MRNKAIGSIITLLVVCGLGFAVGRASNNPWQDPAKITWQQWANVVLTTFSTHTAPRCTITHIVTKDGVITQNIYVPSSVIGKQIVSGVFQDVIGDYPPYEAAIEPGKPLKEFIPPTSPRPTTIQRPAGGNVFDDLLATPEGKGILKEANTWRQVSIDLLQSFQICSAQPSQIARQWHVGSGPAVTPKFGEPN